MQHLNQCSKLAQCLKPQQISVEPTAKMSTEKMTKEKVSTPKTSTGKIQRRQQRFNCVICPEKFKTGIKLDDHCKSKHNNASHKCGLCLERFATVEELKQHGMCSLHVFTNLEFLIGIPRS